MENLQANRKEDSAKYNSRKRVSYSTSGICIYKSFKNGNMKVNNVPHILEKNELNPKNAFLSSESLLLLSRIFKFMKLKKLKEVDYQEFADVESRTDSKSVNSDEEKKMLIKYATDEWILRYHEKKLQVRKDSFGNAVNEASEHAERWLEVFHATLNELPELQRKVIEMKYLVHEIDGRFVYDDFVYQNLHIGKTKYHEVKKDALYKIGLALYDYRI